MHYLLNMSIVMRKSALKSILFRLYASQVQGLDTRYHLEISDEEFGDQGREHKCAGHYSLSRS